MVWFLCCVMIWCGVVWNSIAQYVVWLVYGTIMCVTAWYGTIMCVTVWYGMVWYGMVWYGMVWYGMVWYGNTVHCSLSHFFRLSLFIDNRLESAITLLVPEEPDGWEWESGVTMDSRFTGSLRNFRIHQAVRGMVNFTKIFVFS